MKTLEIVGREIRNIGINIEYSEWTGKIPDRYWVYTYIETNNDYETNKKEGIIILEGFTRKEEIFLEEDKEKILNHFKEFRSIEDNTSIFLSSRIGKKVDTQDIELKKIEIEIDFKEFRGEK